jgi:hypothetical protein
MDKCFAAMAFGHLFSRNRLCQRENPKLAKPDGLLHRCRFLKEPLNCAGIVNGRGLC